ncbi:MAG: hypothetical protein ACP5D2_04115 [Candidatus Nanoarchaeia archaeon]
MNNTLFMVLGCPVCNEMEKAVFISNLSLPIGKKIDMVDIHKGDSRMAYLNIINPGNSFMLPKLILDVDENIGGEWKNLRTIFESSSIKEINTNIINQMFDNDLNLY